MIRYLRLILVLSFTATGIVAQAQSTATTSSPYSRYGVGDLSPNVLPQNLGMGGIGAATNRIAGFSNINFLNPASYAWMNLTVIDAGIGTDINTLSKTGQANQRNATFKYSHLAFGIPISKRSALSFGLRPFSELGYQYRQRLPNFGTGMSADTNAVNYIYGGEGGLTKFYLGYGFGIGKHLAIGANFAYLFGNLKQTQSTEIPALRTTVANSRVEESNAVSGVSYDYGAQYSIDLSERKHIVLGYSASAKSKIKTTNNFIVSNYFNDVNGNEQVATDSIVNQETGSGKIQLPQMNHFGISFQNDGKYLIGADYSMGNWQDFSILDQKQGLVQSKTINVGGQITPNINSLNNYFARVDYRLGFIYDQTYMNINNTNIKKYAATFGLGLPLPRNNNSYYKINIAAEVGRRGSLANGLVKESFVNLHLSFTLNDLWFVKYRYD